jgi:hypothetical protein
MPTSTNTIAYLLAAISIIDAELSIRHWHAHMEATETTGISGSKKLIADIENSDPGDDYYEAWLTARLPDARCA